MLECNEMIRHYRAIQRGSALVVALVFLLVMTLIGTTAMQGTTQQERMAGNYLDRMMAFQGAEGALSVAENSNTRQISPLEEAKVIVPSQQPATWWESESNSLTTSLTGYDTEGSPLRLFSPPRYVPQKFSTKVAGTGDSGVGFAGAIGGAAYPFKCRYAARSVGGSSDAEVRLEIVTGCD